MKRIFSTMLLFIFIAGAIPTAMAYSDITISAVYNSVESSLEVSGTVLSDRGSIPLNLKIVDPNGVFAAGAQTYAELYSGGVGYEFEKIYLPYLTQGGDYTITVSGHFVNNESSVSLYIGGVQQQLQLLNEIEASSNPFDIVKENAADFGIDIKKLNAITTKGQSAFNSVISEKSYLLPAEAVTDDEAKQVIEAFQMAFLDVKEAFCVAEFLGITDTAKLTAWISLSI